MLAFYYHHCHRWCIPVASTALASSGTSSKQLKSGPDARFVGYGSMLTEGFLATLVIVACAAGLGLGLEVQRSVGLWSGSLGSTLCHWGLLTISWGQRS